MKVSGADMGPAAITVLLSAAAAAVSANTEATLFTKRECNGGGNGVGDYNNIAPNNADLFLFDLHPQDLDKTLTYTVDAFSNDKMFLYFNVSQLTAGQPYFIRSSWCAIHPISVDIQPDLPNCDLIRLEIDATDYYTGTEEYQSSKQLLQHTPIHLTVSHPSSLVSSFGFYIGFVALAAVFISQFISARLPQTAICA